MNRNVSQMHTLRRSVSLARLSTAFCIWLLMPIASADVMDDTQTCDSCHGQNGVSTESDVPTIAGFSAFVIEDYMFTYRDDARPCTQSKYRSGDTDRPPTTMCAVAQQLDEDEISEIADYYSAKTFVAAKQDFDAEKAAAGAKIHKRGCEKCHSDGGSYADDDAGILAGQWTPYLQQAFADFGSGDRDMLDEKMAEKFEELDADSITALLHYYASMQ